MIAILIIIIKINMKFEKENSKLNKKIILLINYFPI